MTITVQKWGNSLGVRIPKGIAASAKLREGASVEMEVRGGKVILNPVEVPSLKELLAGLKPGARSEVEDWGQPVGKEVW